MQIPTSKATMPAGIVKNGERAGGIVARDGGGRPRPSSSKTAVRSSSSQAARMATRKPFRTYLGGKDAAGAAEQIIRTFPPHSVYVECFLGNGAVLRHKVPALSTIAIDRDGEVVQRWKRLAFPGVNVIRDDALEWLEQHGRTLPADALVYADPPYPHGTRSSRHRYTHELSDADHARLLALLDALPCSVVVSSYGNDLYARALARWHHRTFRAMTRGGTRTEHLFWKVSSAARGPRVGTDPRYVGRNFRERERIKRKLARWRAKFAALPQGERAAILQGLLDQFRDA